LNAPGGGVVVVVGTAVDAPGDVTPVDTTPVDATPVDATPVVLGWTSEDNQYIDCQEGLDMD